MAQQMALQGIGGVVTGARIGAGGGPLGAFIGAHVGGIIGLATGGATGYIQHHNEVKRAKERVARAEQERADAEKALEQCKAKHAPPQQPPPPPPDGDQDDNPNDLPRCPCCGLPFNPAQPGLHNSQMGSCFHTFNGQPCIETNMWRCKHIHVFPSN